jgi:hypothetical protein
MFFSLHLGPANFLVEIGAGFECDDGRIVTWSQKRK